MSLFERGYGLVIGVGEYGDPAWNVPIAERDAQAIHAALTDPAAGGYPPAQVELLSGAAANRGTVLQALERLSVRAGKGDTVFIATTSHGAPAENNLYTLATSDATFVGGERIKDGTGLSIRDLAAALKQIQADRLLLVINACFAGSASILAARGGLRAVPTTATIPNSDSDTLLASGKGRALISASRADERSYFQPDDTHSAFGQALIDSLRGVGISRRSGYVGLFELYDRIYTQVSRIATSKGYRQEPVLNLVEGVGAFPVALHSGSESTDEQQIQPAQSPDGVVRIVPQTVINQIVDAQNSQGFINNPSGPVNQTFDNRRSSVIDFGSAQISGGVNIDRVVDGDLIETNYYYGGPPAEGAGDERLDPLKELPKLQQRVAVANNVDKFARNNAAFQLSQATVALTEGDKTLAIQFIDAALQLLDAMNNGYINSVARKLREVRTALA